MKPHNEKNSKNITVPRPPVVAVMGHIDHGKSTLLDYIRKTATVEEESGGITQHLGAYEVTHTTKDGKTGSITFLDTPGHEAFCGIRERGATVADIAVLVVSAEEGVKPQTLEALTFLRGTSTPFVVAVTKIDRPNADVERTKKNLAEHNIFVEGYGGTVPCVAISSKTGEGVPELLEMILLIAELNELRAEEDVPATGFVLESDIDKTKGIAATLLIREGTLRKGMFAVAEDSFAPMRCFEDMAGTPITNAGPGAPVRVFCWNRVPRAGAEFKTAMRKGDAEALARVEEEKKAKIKKQAAVRADGEEKETVVPLVLKADTTGSLEAVEHELKKCVPPKVRVKIIQKGVGDINEGDLKFARSARQPIVVGFNVTVDASAQSIAERNKLDIATFDIIYKLAEWLGKKLCSRAPKEFVAEVRGSARVLKIFSAEKDRQVIGGKVLEGEVAVGDEFKVLRREAEIGKGKVKELQKFKEKISLAPKGSEFGAMVLCATAIMPRDTIEPFRVVEKNF